MYLLPLSLASYVTASLQQLLSPGGDLNNVLSLAKVCRA